MAEAKALADWALTRPEVAAVLKGRRTRLLRVVLAGRGKEPTGSTAVLFFRDYGGGVVKQVRVDLETGRVDLRGSAGHVQPDPEEIAEGMAIVRADPAFSSLTADPKLTLMGGFHNRSPYPDDPCAREFCLEFAFMKPGPGLPRPAGAPKIPPRRVIVNLSRGLVVNHDYRANADPQAPAPRMTVSEER